MDSTTVLLGIALICGLYMAWSIGANDVSNAMGTSVGSGALTLKQAIIIAAVLEFCGAFFFGSHVSDTVQRGIVNPEIFAQSPLILAYGMIASLIAAGLWLQVATFFGWPVSTTHSIIGALIGFGIIIGGVHAVYWHKVSQIVLSWVLSPLIGGAISYFFFSILRKKIFYSADPVHAAKEAMPILAFVILTTLSMVLLLKGFKNMNLQISFLQTALISCTTGLVGAGISAVLVRRVGDALPTKKRRAFPSTHAIVALEKAKKHLRRAKGSTYGDLNYQISLILDEVEGIEHAIPPPPDEDGTRAEYKIVEGIFGKLQLVTACFMAFAHGANDVANAIGPLAAAVSVLTTGVVTGESTIPPWILALGGVGIIVGLATWGWRVIETVGKKITELTPSRGFSAEFGAATTIVIASSLGLPISTTHTLVGAVLGVGLARGLGTLNLNTIRDIFTSWIITIPAGAIIAIIAFHILRAIFGG